MVLLYSSCYVCMDYVGIDVLGRVMSGVLRRVCSKQDSSLFL